MNLVRDQKKLSLTTLSLLTLKGCHGDQLQTPRLQFQSSCFSSDSSSGYTARKSQRNYRTFTLSRDKIVNPRDIMSPAEELKRADVISISCMIAACNKYI